MLTSNPLLGDVMHPTPETEAVRTTLVSMFADVDAHRWDAAQARFTPEIEVDYADLGGAHGVVAAADLIAGWHGVLPRFDRTVHKLHDVAIHVAGDRATATADGIAVHALAHDGRPDFWTVFAGYDVEFVRTAATWSIARIRLVLRQQAGNLELPALAATREPTPLHAAPDLPAVTAFFAALEGNDLAALTATFAANVVQDMPLAPAGFPERVSGRDALTALYRNIIERDQAYARTVFATGDPRTVAVAFDGRVRLDDGTDYCNSYVNLFEVDQDGRIARIVEHFHPRTLLARWPGLKLPHYSVHATGASTETVTVERVTFDSEGTTLVGHLFRPADPSLPPGQAVVVTGSWTSVKEQMPDVYASRLAERGFTALTFDFTGFGESGGVPRQLEDPVRKTRDIRAAATWLAALPGIDEVAGLGVCASAGYQAHAAADAPMSKLVLVAPWLHDEAMARTIYDMRPGGSDGLIQASRDAGPDDMALAASEIDPLSAMYVPNHAFDYYLNPTKAAGPHYDNRVAIAGWEGWITFDGISAADALPIPVHVVHSEQGAVPDGTRRFLDRVKVPHSSAWLDEHTQQDFYSEPAAVDAALDEVVGFLRPA